MVWDTGTFEFAIDDLRPIDDIALYPSDVLPDADINTQMVLLEAARIFDERNRDAAQPGRRADARASRHEPAASRGRRLDPSGAARRERHRRRSLGARCPAAGRSSPPARGRARWHAAERLRLQIVSADAAVRRAAGRGARHEVAGVELVAARPGRAIAEPGEPPPIVLVDLRRGRRHPRGGWRAPPRPARAPRSSPWSTPGTPFARVYEAGVLAALPAEVEARRRLLSSTSSRAGATWCAARRGRSDPGAGVARLRRVFGDLRSGLISATVALNLMHIISESVERAVLFLVKRDHLVALGAFGTDPSGRPLAEVTRGLKRRPRPRQHPRPQPRHRRGAGIAFDEADLPEPFRSWSGRRATARW